MKNKKLVINSLPPKVDIWIEEAKKENIELWAKNTIDNV